MEVTLFIWRFLARRGGGGLPQVMGVEPVDRGIHSVKEVMLSVVEHTNE